jgi:hypothetical protein
VIRLFLSAIRLGECQFLGAFARPFRTREIDILADHKLIGCHP